MLTDRYLKVILTIIAIQLFWIGVRDLAPPASAQQAVTPVVIRGIEITDDARALPVMITGTREPLPVETTRVVIIEAAQPIRIEADRPIKVEMDQPIMVESVPYTPAPTPRE